ncbi:MAG: hypothetical protein HQL12_03055 [Candidatus Omnitrophica bacterium]|nr:hypothetical protein [Candidatus Omnitrophota bacterium]
MFRKDERILPYKVGFEKGVSLYIQNGGVVLTHEDKRLIAKIGIDKQSGKESLVYYPVNSMKRVNDGWKIDVDEEHQISEQAGIDLMYGTKPKHGVHSLPVSMRSKTGELIIGITIAKWEIGSKPKLVPLPSAPIPVAAYEESLKKNKVSTRTPQILSNVYIPHPEMK